MSDPQPGESPRTSIPVTARGTEPQGPPTVGSPPGRQDSGDNPGDTPGSTPGGTAGGAEADHRVTVFAALGGQPFFDRLVERFYARVESDDVLLTRAGPEIAVASTKAYITMLIGEYLLALAIGQQRGIVDAGRAAEIGLGLRHLPAAVEEALAHEEAVMELAPHDPEAKAVIHRHFDRVRSLFIDLFERGQKTGAFRTDVPAEQLAAFLFTSAAGAVAMDKADYPAVDTAGAFPLLLETLSP